ncbi:unnamed protein product [Orchesella dallaii]|uniref:Uncharacterized protein n=1 Tax=Orchesella dallaii TaxID=48710 RepID=A0ABP1PJ53_9HEXA
MFGGFGRLAWEVYRLHLALWEMTGTSPASENQTRHVWQNPETCSEPGIGFDQCSDRSSGVGLPERQQVGPQSGPTLLNGLFSWEGEGNMRQPTQSRRLASREKWKGVRLRANYTNLKTEH